MIFTSPGGGIGRRAGLKIQCPLKTCGFDSRPGYKTSRTNREVFLFIHNTPIFTFPRVLPETRKNQAPQTLAIPGNPLSLPESHPAKHLPNAYIILSLHCFPGKNRATNVLTNRSIQLYPYQENRQIFTGKDKQG